MKITITLADLPECTAQEVYDQVCEHLLTQREKSANRNNECQYRGLKNLRCAAGGLMSDKEFMICCISYGTSIEGVLWDELVELKIVPEHHKNLIQSLQHCHDSDEVSYWKSSLFQIGLDYGLDCSKVLEFEGL